MVALGGSRCHGYASTLDMNEDEWQTMPDINLTGVWKTLEASMPHVVAGGRGGLRPQ